MGRQSVTLNLVSGDMGKLFFHMGVFAVVTLCVYAACLFLIKQEARRESRKRTR